MLRNIVLAVAIMLSLGTVQSAPTGWTSIYSKPSSEAKPGEIVDISVSEKRYDRSNAILRHNWDKFVPRQGEPTVLSAETNTDPRSDATPLGNSVPRPRVLSAETNTDPRSDATPLGNSVPRPRVLSAETNTDPRSDATPLGNSVPRQGVPTVKLELSAEKQPLVRSDAISRGNFDKFVPQSDGQKEPTVTLVLDAEQSKTAIRPAGGNSAPKAGSKLNRVQILMRPPGTRA